MVVGGEYLTICTLRDRWYANKTFVFRFFSFLDSRLAGWWGQNRSTRFQMSPEFDPIPGAGGYQHSNPPVLSTIPLIAHLEVLERVGGIQALRKKGLKLTQYLYDQLVQSTYYRSPVPVSGSQESETDKIGFRILTPSDPESRGSQLSLLILPAGSETMPKVFKHLLKVGVIGDERQPDVIRLSPVPMYNRFQDVKIAVEALEQALAAAEKEKNGHGDAVEEGSKGDVVKDINPEVEKSQGVQKAGSGGGYVRPKPEKRVNDLI